MYQSVIDSFLSRDATLANSSSAANPSGDSESSEDNDRMEMSGASIDVNNEQDPSLRELNEAFNGMDQNFFLRLRLWLPFFLILILQALFSHAVRIAYIVATWTVVRLFDESFSESISSQTSISHISHPVFLKYIATLSAFILLSYYIFEYIAKDFTIVWHLFIMPHILGDSEPVPGQEIAQKSFLDCIFLSSAVDLLVQQVILFAKVVFWYISSKVSSFSNCPFKLHQCANRMSKLC